MSANGSRGDTMQFYAHTLENEPPEKWEPLGASVLTC